MEAFGKPPFRKTTVSRPSAASQTGDLGRKTEIELIAQERSRALLQAGGRRFDIPPAGSINQSLPARRTFRLQRTPHVVSRTGWASDLGIRSSSSVRARCSATLAGGPLQGLEERRTLPSAAEGNSARASGTPLASGSRTKLAALRSTLAWLDLIGMAPDWDDEFLSVNEIAAHLRLNQQTVRNWIDQGQL